STANKAWLQQSTQLAEAARDALEAEGFARSTYIGGGTALSLRPDIATNNLSEMPTIMAELGNMRNASDAALMKSAEGQRRYADALATATEKFLAP
ncbi:MAG: N-acetylmuramoyl-L-alanine amidase, partial [Actinomycetales bacterium]|nr:N-acetylmuramoyl-L-alanine amidase [Actinomycetales bacterium]